MVNSYDVLIVGAGPAGLSAAIVLAEHGLRVLVGEKGALPADKPCGEGVMPTGVAHLKRLGVLDHLAEDRCRPFTGIRYHTFTGEQAAAPFREGPGLGIHRLALSGAFLKRARQIPGLEIQAGAPVKLEGRDAGLVQARLGSRPVRARLLVGADGLNSQVRRWAGLEAPSAARRISILSPSQNRWGARQHFIMRPWSEFVEAYWGDGVEAYITPVGEELVNFGFLWDRERCRPAGGDGLIPSLLEHFPELEQRLSGAAPFDAPRAVGPLLRRTASPVGDSAALIGDAAGYLDAITGEGISLAAAQALSMAHTIVPLFQQGSPLRLISAGDLAGYARAVQAITRPYIQTTGLVLLAARYPALVRRLIGALERHPDVFQHFLSANMGLAPLWPGLRPFLGLLPDVLLPRA